MSAPAAPDRLADATALCLTALLHAMLTHLLVGRPAYAGLLGLESLPVGADERWLLPLAVVGNSVLFMGPGLALALVAVALRRPRAAVAICAFGAGLGAAVCIVDLVAYVEFGRHLRDILRFLALPRGHVAAGDTRRWVWRVIALAAASVGLTALAGLVLTRVTRRALAFRSGPFRAFAALLSGASCLALALAPPWLASAWRHSIVIERLFAALPFDLRRETADPGRFTDPALAALAGALSEEYRTAFPRLYVERPLTVTLTPRARPNVVVIVLESWRPDALNAEQMPRLDAWARRGLRLTKHYAGSSYSEAGLFTLLHGRSALEYHATLNARLRPELCELLRRSGWQCGYWSGQPRQWMRQEEFVSPDTFDLFVHDDRGAWVDWDRRAIAGVVAEAERARERPLFALVFLMSSHFEYQYPPEHERHRPTDAKVRFGVTRMESLGAEAAVPLRNRYRNSMAFLDQLLGDALDRLPPERNLVVVTGDHGESLHDDGRFGHGYSFAEVIAQTPAFVVGPGIAPRVVETPTLHTDLLPTIGHALTGAHVPELEHLGGRDLLTGDRPRSSRLIAHCSWDGNEADVLLVSGAERLRLELDLRRPRLTLKGFEDHLGHLRPTESPSPETVERLRAAFAAELASLSGG